MDAACCGSGGRSALRTVLAKQKSEAFGKNRADTSRPATLPPFVLTTKKIPALGGDEMETLCNHLFALRDRDQRITIAEIAYHNHDDPQALNLFLACTMPMAQRMAERSHIKTCGHCCRDLARTSDGALFVILIDRCWTRRVRR